MADELLAPGVRGELVEDAEGITWEEYWRLQGQPPREVHSASISACRTCGGPLTFRVSRAKPMLAITCERCRQMYGSFALATED